VTLRGGYNTSPDWSPTGERIAYAAREDGTYRIAVHDLETGVRRLVSPPGLSAEDPSWAPDGRHLAFSGRRSGRRDLYVLDVEDASSYRITSGEAEYTAPDWSPAPPAGADAATAGTAGANLEEESR
jgi:TolB protein